MLSESFSSSVSGWVGVPVLVEDYEGFVYKITHVESGKYYIGKKSFWKKIRRKPLKGYRRVRKAVVSSDWEKYWGSSKKFTEYVELEGEDKFSRKILRLCGTKSECSYQELLCQIEFDVLNDDKSFNGILNVRLRRTR